MTPEELVLEDVKNALHITWNDEDVDLVKLIKRSMSYLSETTGGVFDYKEEDFVKQLLIDRCRYVYNGATDEFEINYKHELLKLINKVAIEDYKAGLTNENEKV